MAAGSDKPNLVGLPVVTDPALAPTTWELRNGFGTVLHRMHVCDRWCHFGLHMDYWLHVYDLPTGWAAYPSGVCQAAKLLAHFRALDRDND